MPVKDVVKLAKGCGALVCVDGVGYVPHRLVDVKDLERRLLHLLDLQGLRPPSGRDVRQVRAVEEACRAGTTSSSPRTPCPSKFELGCILLRSGGGAARAGAVLPRARQALQRTRPRGLRPMSTTDIAAHETRLTRDLLNYLHVQAAGERGGRGGSAARSESGCPSSRSWWTTRIPRSWSRRWTRVGSACGGVTSTRCGCLNALDLLQYKGVVRVSLVHYNTEAEIARLKEVLDPLLS